jgi:hypothetical protein
MHLRQSFAAASFLSLRKARAPCNNDAGDFDAEGHNEEAEALPTQTTNTTIMAAETIKDSGT